MKRYLLIILVIFVNACHNYSEPILLTNTYFENLYQNEGKTPLPFGKILIHYNKVFPQATYSNYYMDNFYQQANGVCPLFKYTSQELIQKKEQAGFDKESYDAVFMIGKNGITVISRAGYEKLKPTFKPHPYDASLCKPATKK